MEQIVINAHYISNNDIAAINLTSRLPQGLNNIKIINMIIIIIPACAQALGSL